MHQRNLPWSLISTASPSMSMDAA